jgi:hypothetical protein
LVGCVALSDHLTDEEARPRRRIMRPPARKPKGTIGEMAMRHLDTFLGESAKSVGARMGALVFLIVLLCAGIPQTMTAGGSKALATFSQAFAKMR